MSPGKDGGAGCVVPGTIRCWLEEDEIAAGLRRLAGGTRSRWTDVEGMEDVFVVPQVVSGVP